MEIWKVVFFVAFCSIVSYFCGLMVAETRGYKRTSNARQVHIKDLGNVGRLLGRGDLVAINNYLKKALSLIESDPTLLQKIPEDVG